MKTENDNKPAGHGKKTVRKQIEEKLGTTFAYLMPMVGEKKFKKRIKRAGKILARSLNGNENKPSKRANKKVHAEQEEQS